MNPKVLLSLTLISMTAMAVCPEAKASWWKRRAVEAPREYSPEFVETRTFTVNDRLPEINCSLYSTGVGEFYGARQVTGYRTRVTLPDLETGEGRNKFPFTAFELCERARTALSLVRRGHLKSVTLYFDLERDVAYGMNVKKFESSQR